MEYDWDPKKARSNIGDHEGITFDEAKTVFDDPFAEYRDDPDHAPHEGRMIVIGMSSALNLLLVCFVELIDDELTRIISARKPTKHERRRYEEGIR